MRAATGFVAFSLDTPSATLAGCSREYRSMSRRLSLCLLLAACGAPPAPSPVALTHQWGVPAGASLFHRVSLGAAPEGAADSLMPVMPTIVHRLGERCQGEAEAATAGTFFLSFALRGGKSTAPKAEPLSPVAACAIAGLPEVLGASAAELAGLPAMDVVLHLEHAPIQTTPAPPGS